MYYPPVDPDTGLDALVKQPAESRVFTMDFANILDAADLKSITSVTATGLNSTGSSNPVAISDQKIRDHAVSFRIAGGIHGGNYRMEVTVQDTSNGILVGDGVLYVREI